jgi:hypothetical protein
MQVNVALGETSSHAAWLVIRPMSYGINSTLRPPLDHFEVGGMLAGWGLLMVDHRTESYIPNQYKANVPGGKIAKSGPLAFSFVR